MVKKLIIFFFLLAIFISSAAAIECNQQIRNDHVLTKDLLCSDTALFINGSHLTLDCNSHQIEGKGLGSGIEVLGSTVTIRDCNIKGFENGILITNAIKVNVEDSQLRENLIGANIFSSQKISFKTNEITDNSFYGIYSKDSSEVDKENNIFGNNRQDYYELTTDEPAPAPEPAPVEQPDPSPEPITQQDDEKSQEDQKEPGQEEKDDEYTPIKTINDIPLNLPEDIADKVAAAKRVTVSEGITEYDIEITPKKNYKNIQVTEHIPKEVALKSEEIHANIPFKVVEEGTSKQGPVIRFDLADAKSQEKRVVSYSIDREVLSDFVMRPTTFLLLEEAINPGALWIIRVLFSLVMILFAITLYLSKTLHRHHHYLVHLSVFILGIILFILFNIKIEIVISEFANNIVMTVFLSILALILIINNIRYMILLKKVPKKKREIDDLEF